MRAPRWKWRGLLALFAAVLLVAAPVALHAQQPPAAPGPATPSPAPSSTPSAPPGISVTPITVSPAVTTGTRGGARPAEAGGATPLAATGVAGQALSAVAFLSLTAAPATLPVSKDPIDALFVQLLNAAGEAGTLPVTTTVRLASSDPKAASVPSTVEIPAGVSAVKVAVRAGQAGAVTITAQAGGLTSAQARFSIAAASATDGTGSLSLAFAPRQFMAGGTGPAFLTISTLLGEGGAPALASAPLEVRLVSTDPSVIAVPPVATIEAGNFFVTVPVTTGREGLAAVTALRSGFVAATLDTAVLYHPAPAVKLAVEALPPKALAGGRTQPRLLVQALGGGGNPLPFPCGEVQLSSSAPAVLTVPEKVTPDCKPGQQAVLIDLPSVEQPGSANVTAAVEGLRPATVAIEAAGRAPARFAVTLAPAALVYSAPSAGWMVIEVRDGNNTLVPVARDLVVTLDGPPGVAPSTVTVPGGRTAVVVPLGAVNRAEPGTVTVSAPGLAGSSVPLAQERASLPPLPTTSGAGTSSELAFKFGGLQIPVLWLFVFIALAVVGLLVVAVLGARQPRGAAR